jgi:hypothetical protein
MLSLVINLEIRIAAPPSARESKNHNPIDGALQWRRRLEAQRMVIERVARFRPRCGLSAHEHLPPLGVIFSSRWKLFMRLNPPSRKILC